MSTQLVAKLTCDSCDADLRVPIPELRVERGSCFYECDDCGPRMRKLRPEEWKALALAFDIPGGTMISEREATLFALRARRLDDYLEDEGLVG